MIKVIEFNVFAQVINLNLSSKNINIADFGGKGIDSNQFSCILIRIEIES